MSSEYLLILKCVFLTMLESTEFTAQIDLSNITNPKISKYIYGINMYSDPSQVDIPYTGNYTIARFGGEDQTRYNFTNNFLPFWYHQYYITNKSDINWTKYYDVATEYDLSLWTQIPAMGWIAGCPNNLTKCWSYSIKKYGQQTSNECSNQPPDCTWCSSDAGNGVWLNGSNVVGNDPNDICVPITNQSIIKYVKSVMTLYPNNSEYIFSIDNEPTLWSATQLQHDVHPEGATYDEIVNDTLHYGSVIKSICPNCKIAGYSAWGWCGYFEDGYDRDAGFCEGGGPDYISKNNTPLMIYYLQQVSQYEKQYGQRILDILDIHYYPQANGVTGCDEYQSMATNRLQAPRSLYDNTYIDPSWINKPIMLIPMFKEWINKYYPGTMLSISEYNFGADYCITSVIAHSEVLAIFATHGVDVAARWTKPTNAAAPVANAFNIFTNYDGKGGNVYDKEPYAVNVMDSNLEIVTTYSFITKDKSKMFVISYNKDQNQMNYVIVSFIHNLDNLSINGKIEIYGVDKSGLNHVGAIESLNDEKSFNLTLPPWSIRLAIVPLY